MTVLAGNDQHNRELIIKRIFIKLQELLPESESALRERITELEILSSLRSEQLQELIIKEEQNMPIIYNIRKLRGYMRGYKEGVSHGEARALSNTARNMIKEGLSIQLIHKTTSLPLKELKKLQKELALIIVASCFGKSY